MQHKYIKTAAIPLHKMYCHNTIMTSLKKKLIPAQYFSQHLSNHLDSRYNISKIF